jgi:hypothetical protein
VPDPIENVPPPNVNVIFHGLSLIVKRKDTVHILLPNIQQHVYRAGSFLAEETLDPLPFATPYYLTGVKGGDAFLDPTKNIVFPDQNYDTHLGSDKVYARIVLPLPMEVVSLRPSLKPIETDVDLTGQVKGKQPCGVQVFRYRAIDDNLNQVRFKPHSVKALAPHETNNKTPFVNLHIFSEQDKPVDPKHPVDDASFVFDLLPGVRTKVHITSTYGIETVGDDQNDRLNRLGIFNIETLGLIERQRVLRDAGVAWRQGQKFPSTDTIPVVTDSTGCGPFGADNRDGGN